MPTTASGALPCNVSSRPSSSPCVSLPPSQKHSLHEPAVPHFTILTYVLAHALALASRAHSLFQSHCAADTSQIRLICVAPQHARLAPPWLSRLSTRRSRAARYRRPRCHRPHAPLSSRWLAVRYLGVAPARACMTPRRRRRRASLPLFASRRGW